MSSDSGRMETRKRCEAGTLIGIGEHRALAGAQRERYD